MVTIGVDIGGRSHAVARCRVGQSRADREVLRVSQDRAGFAALDAWLERQAEPVTLVTMESSGHYWMALASHLRRHDVPVAVVVSEYVDIAKAFYAEDEPKVVNAVLDRVARQLRGEGKGR